MRSALFALLLAACSSHEEPAANPSSAEPATAEAPATPEPAAQEPAGADTPAQSGDEKVAQGQPCEGKVCGDGLTCVSYYGIAGPQGPKFSSCEIPCADAKDACPTGQRCVTVADGPGQVCRP